MATCLLAAAECAGLTDARDPGATMSITATIPTLDALTATIDTLAKAGGGEAVLGDLRIRVWFRSAYPSGTETLVSVVHTTHTTVFRMRTTTRVFPWIVEYYNGYDPADCDAVAAWYADILDALARGPR